MYFFYLITIITAFMLTLTLGFRSSAASTATTATTTTTTTTTAAAATATTTTTAAAPAGCMFPDPPGLVRGTSCIVADFWGRNIII